jgi:hypothetical protein
VTKSKPDVTSSAHTLRFHGLSPLDFERLCLALLPRAGLERAHHYRAAGREQARGIVARRPRLWHRNIAARGQTG